MAKSKTLKRDDFDLDNDLNFDEFEFGDFDSQISKEATSKKRSPVTEVFKGTITGIKDTVTSPSFLAETVKKTLPEQYGTVFETANEITGAVGSLYDDAVKEIKPQLSRLAKKVDRLVPTERAFLKKITSKFKDLVGDETGEFKGDTKEQLQEQSITNSLAAVFQTQAEKDDELHARDEAGKAIKENIESKRFNSNFGILSSINEQVVKLGNYNEKINQAFQKKTLELQFRSYFTQAELLDTTKKFFDIFQKQHEAIAKNTALPEFVKIKNSERFKEIGYNKLISRTHDSLFGNEGFFSKGINNLKIKAKEQIAGFKEGLQASLEGLDSLEDMKEMNKTMEELGGEKMTAPGMIGNFTGAGLAKWGVNKIIKPLKERLEKSDNPLAKGVRDFGYQVKTAVTNPSALVNNARNSKFIQSNYFKNGPTGYAARILDGVLSAFDENNKDNITENPNAVKSLQDPGIFNNKTRVSIEEIIPGYLAKIHREIIVSRTGNDKIQPVFYDYGSGKFKDSKSIKNSIENKLRKEVESSGQGSRLNSFYDKLFEDKDLDLGRELIIKDFLMNLMTEDKKEVTFNQEDSIDKIKNTKSFKNLNEEIATLVETKLQELIGSENQDRYKNISSLTTDLEDLRVRNPNLTKTAGSYIYQGHGDQLEELGLYDRTEDGNFKLNKDKHQKYVKDVAIKSSAGGDSKKFVITVLLTNANKNGIKNESELKKTINKLFEQGFGKDLSTLGVIEGTSPKNYKINYEVLKKLLDENGYKESDISLKRNVNLLKPKDALSSLKKTNIYKWFYKLNKGDQKQKIGPMAGDVKKTIGDDASSNGKTIDLVTMNGVNMASIKAVDERQAEQQKQIEQLKTGKIIKTGKNEQLPIPGVTVIDNIKTNTDKIIELLTNISELNIKIFDLSGIKDKANQAVDKGKEVLSKGKEAAIDAKDYILAKGDSYKDTVGNLAKSTGTLMLKMSGDLLTAVGNTFSIGTKVAGGAARGISDVVSTLYKNNKDKAAKALGGLFGAGADLATKVVQTATDLAFNKLPAGWSHIANLATKAKNAVVDWMDAPVDAYIKGLDVPVMKANLMKMGYYLDQSTGKAIYTIKDLLKIKGNIVNKEGNVVLTMEDMRDGLFDKNGQPIKTFFSKLAGAALGMAIAGIGRAKDAVLSTIKIGKSTLETGGGFLKNKFNFKNKLLDALKDLPQFNMPDIGIMGTKSYDVLVEIRDLIKDCCLGSVGKQAAGVKKASAKLNEIKKTAEANAEKTRKQDSGKKTVEGIKQKAIGVKDKAKKVFRTAVSSVTDNQSADDKFVGPVKPLVEQAKDKLTSIKDYVAPKTDTLTDSVKETASRVRDRLEKLYSEKPEAEKNKEPETAEVLGRIEESENKTQNIFTKLIDRFDKFLKDKEEKSTASPVTTTTEEVVPSSSEEQPSQNEPKYVSGGQSGSLIEKGMGLFSKAKDKFSDVKKGMPSIMAAKGIKGKALALAGSLFSGSGDNTEENKEKKPVEETQQQEPKKGILSNIKDKIKKKVTTVADRAKAAFNDKDASGKRDGSWEDRLKKQEELKNSRNNGVVGASLAPKYRDGDGLGGIIGMAKNLLGMLGGGMGGMIKKAGGLFSTIGKFLGIGGKGSIIGRVGSVLAKVVMSPLKMLLGGGKLLGTVGRVGFAAARLVGAAALPALGAIGSAALSVGGALLSGAAAIISSPVVLGAAAIAAVGIAGYYGYKYYKRNDADKFQDIRLKQYGLTNSENDKKFNHYILQLEDMLTDGCIGYDNKQPYIIAQKLDIEKVLSLFDIDKNDKQAVDTFMQWFNGRFKPFFLTNVAALMAVDNKTKLPNVQSLKPDEQLKFLKLISFESGPYDVDISPFKDLPKLSTGKEAAINAIEALIKELSEKQEKATKDKTAKQQKDQNKPVDKNDDKSTSPSTTIDAKPKDVSNQLGTEPPKPKAANDPLIDIPLGEEGTPPAVIPEETIGSVKQTNGKLPLADGPIKDGVSAGQYIKLQPGVKLDGANPELLNNFKGMVQEYGELTGKSVIVTSGSRSRAEQEALFKKNPKKAAAPGKSLHEFGLAMDVNSADLDQLEKYGLMKKYGFTRPVGGEPWHTEPAGIQVNPIKAKEDPNFATTAIAASLYKGGGGVGSIPGSKLGRRDTELAISLLNAPGDKVASSDKDKVTNSLLAKSPENTKVASSDKKQAANEPKIENTLAKPKLVVDNTASGTSIGKDINQSNKYSLNDKLVQPDSGPPKTTTAGVTDVDGKTDTSGKNSNIKQVIHEASRKAGTDPSMMTAFAAVESSLNPNARASTSSASGLYQFTSGTWKEQLAKNGTKYGLSPNTSPTDPTASTLLASEYVKSNMKFLEKTKPNPNMTDVYLAHFLGAGGARKFLSSDPNEYGSKVLPEAAKSNAPIFYNNGSPLSLSEIYKKIEGKIVKAAQSFGIALSNIGSGFGDNKQTANKEVTAGAITKPNTAADTKQISPPKQPDITSGSSDKSTPPVESTVAKSSQVNKTPEFLNQQQTVLSSSKGSTPQQGFGSDILTSGINTVNDTMVKSLGVQEQMLDVLKKIMENVNPENLNAFKESLNSKKDGGGYLDRGPALRQVPDPAVNLRRRQV